MTFDDYLNYHAIESVYDGEYSTHEMSQCWNTALAVAIEQCQNLRKDSVTSEYDEGVDDALAAVEQAIWGLRSQ